jgi:hypothetical protein
MAQADERCREIKIPSDNGWHSMMGIDYLRCHGGWEWAILWERKSDPIYHFGGQDFSQLRRHFCCK